MKEKWPELARKWKGALGNYQMALLVLADGALLPGSVSTPEVKLDWAAREEKARALAQEQRRLCGPVLRDGDFYFGRA